MDHDAIVIGSGFGGAPAALRLAEAGYDVLVLERGRRWQPADFEQQRPDATFYPREPHDPWIYDPEDPSKKNGWVEVRRFKGMWVVAGAGVGGGSLHFSNVVVGPATASFEEGWPKPFRDNPHALDGYVQRVGDTLEAEQLPDNQLTRRFELVRDGATAAHMSDRFDKLDLTVRFDPNWTYAERDGEDPRQSKFSEVAANRHGVKMGSCVHLGNCNIGCDVNARKILDTNYIPAAEAAGAEVRQLHLVRSIEPINGGYRLTFDQIDPDAERSVRGALTARIIVLACGSLGSTELLLRCRHEFRTLPSISRHLGRNWSPNGDFFTPAIYDDPVHLTWGPPITGAVDFTERPDDKGERYFVQDVGFPNVLDRWVRDEATDGGGSGVEAEMLRYAAEQLGQGDDGNDDSAFSRLMFWFGQAQDAGDGELRLRRKYLWGLFGPQILDLKWSALRSAGAFRAIGAMQEKLAQASGGRPLVPFNLGAFPAMLATFHPLGGCNMADAPGEGIEYTDSHGRRRRTDEGVVDHRGEVFGYRNLFVADGAVIPEAVGRNPSRTIAAVAERTAEIIVQEGR